MKLFSNLVFLFILLFITNFAFADLDKKDFSAELSLVAQAYIDNPNKSDDIEELFLRAYFSENEYRIRRTDEATNLVFCIFKKLIDNPKPTSLYLFKLNQILNLIDSGVECGTFRNKNFPSLYFDSVHIKILFDALRKISKISKPHHLIIGKILENATAYNGVDVHYTMKFNSCYIFDETKRLEFIDEWECLFSKKRITMFPTLAGPREYIAWSNFKNFIKNAELYHDGATILDGGSIVVSLRKGTILYKITFVQTHRNYQKGMPLIKISSNSDGFYRSIELNLSETNNLLIGKDFNVDGFIDAFRVSKKSCKNREPLNSASKRQTKQGEIIERFLSVLAE